MKKPKGNKINMKTFDGGGRTMTKSEKRRNVAKDVMQKSPALYITMLLVWKWMKLKIYWYILMM